MTGNDAAQPPSPGPGGKKFGCFFGALVLLAVIGTPVGFGVYTVFENLHA